MHLQQTKAGSRRSGGPQYYFHDVPDAIREHLRRKRVCPVVLQTPYGIASSPFLAVDRDHKVDRKGRVVKGKVGHDRIQQATEATESIGEAIRRWYDLPVARDFERIDVEVTLHSDGHFILSPTRAILRGSKRSVEIEKPLYPLSVNHSHQSRIWCRQLENLKAHNPGDLDWASSEISRILDQHIKAKNVHEADLLRTAGAFSKLGVHLGPYHVRHYDCDPSSFKFLNFERYLCPIEIKKRSRHFEYQILHYKPLPRAVVLCVEHDLINVPEHVDVIELSFLSQFLKRYLLG